LTPKNAGAILRSSECFAIRIEGRVALVKFGAFIRLAICAGCILLFVSCASAPVQEMSDARQAITAAERAGADRYSPVELSQARTALGQAVSQLQENEFSMARDNANRARNRAIKAREKTLKKKGVDN